MIAFRSWLRTPRLALTLLACLTISLGGTARHPIALVTSVFLLIVVALLACWIPARRAARTDPMTALRAE